MYADGTVFLESEEEGSMTDGMHLAEGCIKLRIAPQGSVINNLSDM